MTGTLKPIWLELHFIRQVLFMPMTLPHVSGHEEYVSCMGGPHVTLVPEEASQYADVIFIGEAEGLWEEFLKGFETGSYLCVYQQTSAAVS